MRKLGPAGSARAFSRNLASSECGDITNRHSSQNRRKEDYATTLFTFRHKTLECCVHPYVRILKETVRGSTVCTFRIEGLSDEHD